MHIDSLPGQNPALGHDVYKEGTITAVRYKFLREAETKLVHQQNLGIPSPPLFLYVLEYSMYFWSLAVAFGREPNDRARPRWLKLRTAAQLKGRFTSSCPE